MSDEITDDGSYIVPPGEAALITYDDMDKLQLLIPKELEQESGHVSETVLFLTACLVRHDRDPEFREEQIEWFKNIKEELN